MLAVRQPALVARVRLVGVVNAFVRGQVAHLRELPAANVAYERCVAGVDAADVRAQVAHLCERLAAHCARVRLFARVHAHVVHQVANVSEPFAAHLAFALVRRQVLGHEPLGREHPRAPVAFQIPSALQTPLPGDRPPSFRWLYWSLQKLLWFRLLWLILMMPPNLLCPANDETIVWFPSPN